MVTQMTRRVKFKVKELKEGDFFGHDEIISHSTRNSRVYSLHETTVFYLNIVNFRRLFSEEKIKELQKVFPPVNFDEVGQTIIENEHMKRKFSEAFLSGINLNSIPVCLKEDRFEDPRIKRFKVWIDKAKHSNLSITNSFLKFNKLETMKITYNYYEIGRDHQELKPITRLANIKDEIEEKKEK